MGDSGGLLGILWFGLDDINLRGEQIWVAFKYWKAADEDTNAELRAMLEEGSPSFEHDDLVRRAIAIGLSTAGETDIADAYVDELRADTVIEVVVVVSAVKFRQCSRRCGWVNICFPSIDRLQFINLYGSYAHDYF